MSQLWAQSDRSQGALAASQQVRHTALHGLLQDILDPRKEAMISLRHLVTGCKVGSTYLFWDSDLYRKQGGRDVGNNSQCWAEAVVLTCPDRSTRPNPRRPNGWEVTATVRFLHSGRVSRGMFIDMITPAMQARLLNLQETTLTDARPGNTMNAKSI
jgi:hypothetical protein